MMVIFTAPNEGDSILTRNALLNMLDVHEAIAALQLQVEGKTVTLQTECAKLQLQNSSTSACLVQSVLDLWGYNRTLLEAQTDATILAAVQAPIFEDRFGRPMPRSTIIGGIDVSGGLVTGAAALQSTFVLMNNLRPVSGAADNDPEAAALEEAAAAVGMRSYAFVRAYYNGEEYEKQEQDKAIADDVVLISAGYSLLMVYGAIVLARRHPVKSRATLAIASVASIALAIGATFGLCLLIGLKFNLVVQSVFFLMLGLGFDDTFVIMGCHLQTDPNLPIQERIARTIASAGVSITVTSVTDFVAFALGAINDIPAISTFCMYAAVGIVFDFVLQVTLFVAFIALDGRRQADNRTDIFCCCRRKTVSTTKSCSKETFDEQEMPVVSKFIGKTLPRLTLHPIGMGVVMAVLVAVTVVGAVGTSQMKMDFDAEWFTPDNSPLQDTYRVRDRFFPGRVIPVNFYTRRGDYFANMDALDRLEAVLVADPMLLNNRLLNWWTVYKAFVATPAYTGSKDAKGRPGSEADFYSGIRSFLDRSKGSPFRELIVFTDSSRSAIRATEAQAYYGVLPTGQSRVDAMLTSRRNARAASELDVIAYSFPFLFWEGLAIVVEQTVRNLLLAAVAVFCICLVLLANVWAALLVLLMIALVDVQLLGTLYYWGVDFNIVSAINLVLAVGLAVDYAAHVAHSFMTMQGTRKQRAARALEHIGGPVVNGAVSTFLAVVMLSASRSYIFQTFFKCFTGIVVFGVFEGIVVLPVVLALIGPAAYPTRKLQSKHSSDEVVNVVQQESGRPNSPDKASLQMVTAEV